MSSPLGGSMTQLMATASEHLDTWVKHAKDTNASTPELVAMLLMQTEQWADGGKIANLAIMLATAVQSLAAQEEHP